MPPNKRYPAKQEQSLMSEIWQDKYVYDPYAYTLFAYPWGKNNSILSNSDGPNKWQADYLIRLSDHMKENKHRSDNNLVPVMWRHATASGRGVGKSALVGWLCQHMMSCVIGSSTIVTANTEPQLKSRTFAEISKWFTLSINSHWFESTVLSIRLAKWFADLIEQQLKIDTAYYYVLGQLWSEENPDAFAGIHNMHGVNVVYDEASGIPDSIFKVTEGFFTDPTIHRYWNVYSNPRRNSGGFYSIFHEHSDFWKLKSIDARTVDKIDQEHFNRIIEQYGIDSDTVRVEVLGQFPDQSDRQFIPTSLVYSAQKREIDDDPYAALILGIDVARGGNDSTIFRWRQGRNARCIPPIKLRKRDNMFVAEQAAIWIDKTSPDAVNIDAGMGAGVIDRLRQMGYKVNEIWFGGEHHDKRYADNRTELFAKLRDWLSGGCIDSDPDLFRDLTAPEWDFWGKGKDIIKLESNESIKSRGLPSCDNGSALALTFALNIARRDAKTSRFSRRNSIASGSQYSLFGG